VYARPTNTRVDTKSSLSTPPTYFTFTQDNSNMANTT
jgi:hypothetical protein